MDMKNMEGADMKTQANYIWNRLDDLMSTDPQAYKKFMDKQMEERKIYMSDPKAEFCLHTTAQIDGEKVQVFVNVCSWPRMPDVEGPNDPVKLYAGKTTKFRFKKNEKPAMCIPIAVNDRFFGEICKSKTDKKDFIKLCLEMIRRNSKIPVSFNFKMHTEIFAGIFPAKPRKLFISGTDSQDPLEMLGKGEMPSPEKLLSSPESLLKNLSMGDDIDEKINEKDKQLFDSLIPSSNGEGGEKKKKLIEELDAEPQEPDYSFIGEGDGEMKLKISLPLVVKMTECDLNISKNEIQLRAGSKYKLDLKLPKEIDEDNAAAKFNRKTSNLTLTAPHL